MRFNKLFAAAAVLFFPAIASADPCAGASPFTDVPASENYCTNTEWLKNRGITLGCTSATLFCPGNVVTRASMALFMNRLGVALSPEAFRTEDSPGALDLDAANDVCQTNDYAVTGFPRRIFATSTFTGLAQGALDYIHDLIYSTNSGMTWSFVNPSYDNRGGISSARWTNTTHSGFRDFNVGETVRFGIRIIRTSGGTVSTQDFDDSRCFLTFLVHNRNGATSPLDSEPQARGLR